MALPKAVSDNLFIIAIPLALIVFKMLFDLLPLPLFIGAVCAILGLLFVLHPKDPTEDSATLEEKQSKADLAMEDLLKEEDRREKNRKKRSSKRKQKVKEEQKRKASKNSKSTGKKKKKDVQSDSDDSDSDDDELERLVDNHVKSQEALKKRK